MFGQYSKPLHLPQPHHRDRRAGAITEVYERGLRAPRRAVALGPWRPAAERRQSRARLAARRAARARDLSPLVALAVLVVAFWLIVVMV